MAACRFDPAALRCLDAKATDCLGPAQVEALQRVFGGARDGRGRALYAGWLWDAGVTACGGKLLV